MVEKNSALDSTLLPSEIDIRTIDPQSVPDIRDIHIDTMLPPHERVADMIRQMNGNPFVYRCGNILVKTSFSGTRPLQDILEECLEKS
ncbi:DUF6870 family protein [Dysosmobacter sp.]